MFSSGMVKPAASSWPPKPSSRSEQDSSAAKRLKPAVGAAGALAGAVLQMDHEAGAGVFFAEAGGYDAHHALMPFLAGEHQRVALLRPAAARSGRWRRRRWPAPPPGRSRFRSHSCLASSSALARIGLLQKVRGQIRSPHAPGGVDPGGENEADLDGGDGLAQQPCLFQKGVDAHKIRVVQGLKAAGDDGAVFALHPHDVGNGADGGQSAVPGEQGVLPVSVRPEPAPASAPRPRQPDI